MEHSTFFFFYSCLAFLRASLSIEFIFQWPKYLGVFEFQTFVQVESHGLLKVNIPNHSEHVLGILGEESTFPLSSLNIQLVGHWP